MRTLDLIIKTIVSCALGGLAGYALARWQVRGLPKPEKRAKKPVDQPGDGEEMQAWLVGHDLIPENAESCVVVMAATAKQAAETWVENHFRSEAPLAYARWPQHWRGPWGFRPLDLYRVYVQPGESYDRALWLTFYIRWRGWHGRPTVETHL